MGKTRQRPGAWRRRVAALVILAGLAGPACGSGSDEASPVVLRVLMTDDWVTPPFVAAVRDFERRHPEVRVVVDRNPINQMLDAVAVGIRNGMPPDVVQAHAFSAAAAGLAEPLDDLWRARLRESEFLAGAMEDVRWAGRIYGVPLDTNALFLIYNRDHLAAAGVGPPTGHMTFEDFERLARAVSTPDGSRRALALPTDNWWTYGWIRANGGELVHVGADGTVVLTLDAPEVVEAVGFLDRLVSDNLAFAPRAADSPSDDALALFRAGSTSMLASGSWDLAVVKRDEPGATYRAALLPQGAGAERSGSVMGGSSMFVPRGSRHRRLAFEFMVQVVSDRYALRLAKEEGRLPVRRRVYRDPWFEDPDLAAVLSQLESAHPFRLQAFEQAEQHFAAALDQVLRGDRDAATALGEAQARAQASLAAAPR